MPRTALYHHTSFQIARTYYLPDYQQQINNVKGDSFTDRGNEDDTNRNDTCSSGGYYSSPLGSGYNCSRVVYAHQACYSCTAKPCPSGYTAGLTKCADKTGYSASYSSNGLSGTQTCGKCDYKELSCASGYSTNYQSVSDCGTTGSAGWTFTSNGYSGNDKCGTCVSSCQMTSCNQTLIRANDEGSIMGLYVPAASMVSFCAGGSYFQSGNPHADVNDNCGIKRCYGCDVNATYKTYFENAGSSGSAVETYFNNCLSGCMWVTPPLAADKYVCYTMCNVAKQRWMLEHAGQNLTPQNQIFLCPYNNYDMLVPCCDSWEGSRQSLYNRLVGGQQFLAFTCSILKETPSCRPSCSSW